MSAVEAPWARGGTGRRRPPKPAGTVHGSSSLPGPTPLADAADAIEREQEDEAGRTQRDRVLRARMNEADQLINEMELLNLADADVVPGRIGRRVAELDQLVRHNDAPAPEAPGDALDRLYLIQDVLCRELQTWWFDFEAAEAISP